MTDSLLLLLLLPIAVMPLAAQPNPHRVDFEKMADEIFPLQDQDLNYEELYENLAQRLSHPLDLNTATADELRSLYVLRETEITDLIHYRSNSGGFISIYELQTVLDLGSIYRLIPFVELRSRQSADPLLKRILREDNNYFILRFERTVERHAGYQLADSARRYQGSPYKAYARFRTSQPGDFSIGFTGEKDPGELFRPTKGQITGFDFSSCHIQLQNKRQLKNFIVGDYQAQFGQGLVLGGGFGMGKGSETITTVRRSTLGFLPYTSLNESGFFRGMALTLKPTKRIQFSAFGSALGRDASAQTDSVNGMFVTSFSSAGLHRTTREILARRIARETNYGFAAEVRENLFHAGIVGHRTVYDIPLRKDPDPYNSFAFSGTSNSNVSLFFDYGIRNFSLFGEAAQTLGHGRGVVVGLLGSLTRTLDASLLFRKFDRDYYSFFSNALSESSTPQNESGIYWGWKYAIGRKMSWAGYVDLFRFPWLKFRVDAPSMGSEALLRLNYKPRKTTEFFFQMREERKARNIAGNAPISITGIGIKRNYAANAAYTFGPWSFKTRLQYSTFFLDKRTKGMVLIQDVGVKLKKLSISSRYALFDTEDFENRQYAYEQDLWLAFSFPAYNGTGLRAYLLAQYSLGKKVDIWLRWSKATYFDVDGLGSGPDRITGDTRRDLKAQVRLKL